MITPKQFRPHRFAGIESGVTVRLAARAMSKMFLFVDHAEEEIGWLGTCRRRGLEFIVEEVFLFEQNVDKTSTVISAEALATFVNELLKKKNGMGRVNRLRLWGHSHGSMSVAPSETDDRQMDHFRGGGVEYFIRTIANRHGMIRFDIYLYENEKVFFDVPWMVDYRVDGRLRRSVAEEIANKVKSRHLAI